MAPLVSVAHHWCFHLLQISKLACPGKTQCFQQIIVSLKFATNEHVYEIIGNNKILVLVNLERVGLTNNC